MNLKNHNREDILSENNRYHYLHTYLSISIYLHTYTLSTYVCISFKIDTYVSVRVKGIYGAHDVCRFDALCRSCQVTKAEFMISANDESACDRFYRPIACWKTVLSSELRSISFDVPFTISSNIVATFVAETEFWRLMKFKNWREKQRQREEGERDREKRKGLRERPKERFINAFASKASKTWKPG